MKVKATVGSGAGLTQRQCDNCKNPISFGWQGRDGEYCSNKCLEESERRTTMSEETINKGTATAASKKKGASKAAKGKKAAAKGKAAKAEGKAKKEKRGGNGRGMYPNEAKIQVLAAGKENPYRGSRAKKFGLITKAATVGAYKDAATKAGFDTSLRPLQRAVEQGLIKIS